jgi:hypothetical protein
MMALLSGLGIKDIFYGVLVSIALTWGGWTYHKYESAVTYAANAKAETAAALVYAQRAIDDLNKQHAAEVASIQVNLNADLNLANAKSSVLADKLRQYQATRCPSAVLGSAAPAPAGGAAGTGSVEQALEGVVAAAAHDHAVISAERRERDSLTGK